MSVLIEKKMYSKAVRSRERSIEIFLNGEAVAVSQGSPDDLAELGVGFLLAEGLLRDRGAFRGVKVDAESAQVFIWTDEDVAQSRELMYRVSSSGCAQSALLRQPQELSVHHVDSSFDPERLLAMIDQLCEISPKRNRGEGVHGCALGTAQNLVCVREDIGRHNAMDKVIGRAWLDRMPMQEMALFTTGRISHEMALKAVQAGVGVLVSRKSVTDAAIEIAEETGITLVGKCRENSMQVLSFHDRIQ